MLRYYRCKGCDQIFEAIGSTQRLGSNVEEIIPNTGDGSLEKHQPIIKIDDCVVNVSVNHPITDTHMINYIILETDKSVIRKSLDRSNEASFIINNDEKVLNAYSLCNLHGIFKS